MRVYAKHIASFVGVIAVFVLGWRWIPRLEGGRLADQLQRQGATFELKDSGEVDWVRFPPSSGDAELESLRDAAHVRHLDLSGTMITDAGLERLGILPRLQMLDLSNTPSVTRGFVMAARCPALLEIRASGNRWVSDDELQCLAGLPNLQVLDLRNTALTDQSADVLAELPGLTWISLDQCTGISDETLRRIEPLERLVRVSAIETQVTWAAWRPAWQRRPDVFAADNPLLFADFQELRAAGAEFSGFGAPVQHDQRPEDVRSNNGPQLTIGPAAPADGVAQVVQLTPAAAIRVNNAAFSNELLLQCLRNSPQLVELDVSGSAVTGNVFPVLEQECPLLHLLNLSDTAVAASEMAAFPRLPQLQVLRLQGLDLRDADLSALAHLPMYELDLSRSRLSDDVLATLPVCENLWNLSLADAELSDEELLQLTPQPALQSLDLSGTQLTGQGLQRLGQIPSLRSVRLAGTPLDPEQLLHLSSIPDLYSLSFGAELTLRHLQVLSKVSVNDLTIDQPTFGASGVEALDAIPGLTSLRLTGSVAPELLDQLTRLQRVRHLDLQEADVDLEFVASLREGRPGLSITTRPLDAPP